MSDTRDERLRAEARKFDAEAKRFDAEAAWHEEATRKTKAEADITEIGLARVEREEEAELARNHLHQVFSFSDEVTSHSVAACIKQLTHWMRTLPGCDIEIIFNSPGGDVTEGMALFDYIQIIRQKGHKITTVALGMAASMAGILLQAGEVRVIGAEAWVLIHEASFGASGKIGEVEDRVEWVKMVQKRILAIFAARSNLAVKTIEKNWKRKDWWLSSDDCLKYGFADEIRGIPQNAEAPKKSGAPKK